MNVSEPSKSCSEIAPLLTFYACQEVDEQERADIAAHLPECAACRQRLAEEEKLQAAFAAFPQAAEELDDASNLLANCRTQLAESLDDLARPAAKEKPQPFRWLRAWMILHPALSGALLIALGLVAGIESTRWSTGREDINALDQAMDVHPASRRISDDQLAKMGVIGVNFTTSAPGMQKVRVQLNADQPYELTGSMDDTDVRRVLTYVVENGDRFDSGVRLDCLDALKTRAADDAVRGALLAAARKDQNPAVRLKALDALRERASDHVVREALLDALKHDGNPGVRVEAVNLLVNSIESEPPEALAPFLESGEGSNTAQVVIPASSGRSGDGLPDGSLENVIRTLDNLQHTDANRYVRLRSAAALRQLNGRNEQ